MAQTVARRTETAQLITNVIAALAVAVAWLVAGGADAADTHAIAIEILRTALGSEPRWIKVHAAEALLAVDAAASRDRVAHTFERELAAHNREPEYRIGIWRVLAQTARARQPREALVRQIAAAFLDEKGPDRLHASETLGKLAYRARPGEIDAFERASHGDSPLAANALWVLANSGRPDAERRLADLLRAPEAVTRTAAAYAMRYLPTLQPQTWNQLAGAVGSEPSDDILGASLVAAAFVHAPADRKAALAAMLAPYARRGTADVKAEVCGALAMAGRAADEALAGPLLIDDNIDVRIAAARAILQIERRSRR